VDKKVALLAVTIGGTVGGFIPELWHANWLSAWGIITSGVGALVGLWLAWHYYG